MIIDRLFQTAQAILDKEQKDYLRPLYFNLYVNNALHTVFNKLLSDVKSNVRKSNWMLDGKNLADFSEHLKQILEFYLTPGTIQSQTESFNLPNNLSLIQDVTYSIDRIIEKVDIDDYTILKRNKTSAPTLCSPICTKIGSTLLVHPVSISEISLIFLRKPQKANWTFNEFEGKAMFDPTKPDFMEVDAPEILFDELLNAVLKQAGVSTRDPLVVQNSTQNENQNLQIENKQ